jgi:gas vesicle protein
MKLTSLFAGMGIGAAVALLLAPRSGEETREILSDKVEEGKQYAKDRVQDIRDAANDTLEQGKKIVARKAKAVAAAAGAGTDAGTRESQTETSY